MDSRTFRLITRILITIITGILTWNVWAGLLTFGAITYIEFMLVEMSHAHQKRQMEIASAIRRLAQTQEEK